MHKLFCIVCHRGCLLTVLGQGEYLTVEGNNCSEAIAFAKEEFDNPSRTLTTTARTNFPDVPVIPVRTDGEIPVDDIKFALKEIKEYVVRDELGCGDIIIEDVAETGINVILTSNALKTIGAELENRNAEINKATGSTGGEFNPDSAGNPFAEMAGADAVNAARSHLSGVAGGDSADGAGGSVAQNPDGVLDDIGMDSADGFVGTAGEAVGVESSDDDSADGTGKRRGRSHIRIK